MSRSASKRFPCCAGAGIAQRLDEEIKMAKIDAAERSFRFHYSTTIREDQSKDGAVAVWIPLPQTTEHQIIGPVEMESPFPYVENVEPKLGNRMAYVEVPKGSPATKIVAHYDV